MSELRALARLRIHPGKLEQFKAAAERCMAVVRAKDQGTLQYDWYLTPDGAECVVFERYRDSDAVMQHMGHVGDALGELLTLADLSIQVVGEPSDELMAASEGLNVQVLTQLKSL